MCAEMLVQHSGNVQKNADIDRHLLRDRGLFKMLSIVLCSQYGLSVPNTALLLDRRKQQFFASIGNWSRPHIYRVEYTTRPDSKVLGGVPIQNQKIASQLTSSLFKSGYYPLVHSYLDRFQNSYSAGVLLSSDSSDAFFEIVGPGFDAGDLRLGLSNPHEVFSVNLRTSVIHEDWTIPQEQYVRSRQARCDRIARLSAYFKYVNSHAILLPELPKASVRAMSSSLGDLLPPKSYEPIPKTMMNRLIHIAESVRRTIIPQLPSSKSYAVSLSYVKPNAWIIWDIYGEWYER